MQPSREPAPPPALTPTVRPYRPADLRPAATLLYESAGGMYDRYAGSRSLAERTLKREGNCASPDVVRIAELDGHVAGAMAAMPFEEWTRRAHAFLRVTLRSVPVWRWAAVMWLYRASGRAGPQPPRGSLYVDSLATAVHARRRGVARALLAEAERLARERELDCVALDTWLDNRPARALYESAGFEELARTPPTSGLPGAISLVKPLD